MVTRARVVLVPMLACLLCSSASAQATWVAMNPPTSPSARVGHKMAFDSLRGRVVLFGGSTASGLSGETWEWDGSTWTMVSNTGPAARWMHAMTYDSRRGRVVMLGGAPADTATWEWDGSTWSAVASGPAGSMPSMAFDSVRGQVVLFGAGETWEWDGSTWTQASTTPPVFGLNQGALAF